MTSVYKVEALVFEALAPGVERYVGQQTLRLETDLAGFILFFDDEGDDGLGQTVGYENLSTGGTNTGNFIDVVQFTVGGESVLAVEIGDDDDYQATTFPGAELGRFIVSMDGPLPPEPGLNTLRSQWTAQNGHEPLSYLSIGNEVPRTDSDYPAGAEITIREVRDSNDPLETGIDGFQYLGEIGESLLTNEVRDVRENGQIVQRTFTPDDRAKEVARLYEAGLNRDGNIDEAGLNFWIDALAEGQTRTQLSSAFLTSDEFTQAFGAVDTLSDTELVEQLYLNVLNRAGEQAGIDFWVEVVGRPSFSREDLLIAFADSPENLEGTEFVEDLFRSDPGIWEFPVA